MSSFNFIIPFATKGQVQDFFLQRGRYISPFASPTHALSHPPHLSIYSFSVPFLLQLIATCLNSLADKEVAWSLFFACGGPLLQLAGVFLIQPNDDGVKSGERNGGSVVESLTIDVCWFFVEKGVCLNCLPLGNFR